MVLKNRVAIYVPATFDGDTPTDSQAITDETMSFLSSMFGGATQVQASGAWVSPEKGLIKEPINIVYAFADTLSSEILASIKDFACYIKVSMGQEAVSVEINGELHLI